jgi:hypothetical protein
MPLEENDLKYLWDMLAAARVPQKVTRPVVRGVDPGDAISGAAIA